MSKPLKPRSSQAPTNGVFKGDALKDLAESLNISLPDAVSSALASDVEYRIHQVVEEAARFMRHGRRTTMTSSDIDHALRVLNIEPLYGHTPYNPSTFRRALPFPHSTNAGPVYFVEDEELDFDRVIREEKITLPKGVTWNAHWLAVEGVQPLIPENPPAIPREAAPDPNAPAPDGTLAALDATGAVNGGATASLPGANLAAANSKLTQQQQQQLVKQVLSRELQLYYARLTGSLLPPTSDFAKRTAALSSLRSDAGLQALLPYLVRWVAEGVVGALKEGAHSDNDGKVLEVLMDVVSALLENSALFVEPYLHQILPPVLSTLLHSSLPPSHATQLRTAAAQTLSRLLTQHSTTYPSLSPRIMKTLLLALISPGKSKGTREGAIRGLVGIGKEAVRKGLVEGGGAKVVASECQQSASHESSALMSTTMEALQVLQPPMSDHMSDGLNRANPADAAIYSKLMDLIGDYFASTVASDSSLAREIVGISPSDS